MIWNSDDTNGSIHTFHTKIWKNISILFFHHHFTNHNNDNIFFSTAKTVWIFSTINLSAATATAAATKICAFQHSYRAKLKFISCIFHYLNRTQLNFILISISISFSSTPSSSPTIAHPPMLTNNALLRSFFVHAAPNIRHDICAHFVSPLPLRPDICYLFLFEIMFVKIKSTIEWMYIWFGHIVAVFFPSIPCCINPTNRSDPIKPQF